MSGDVMAAIERLRFSATNGWFSVDEPDIAEDARTVLAEVERLRAQLADVDETFEGINADEAMYLRKIERLTNEVERLRAEREALHSDETRERLTAVADEYGVHPSVTSVFIDAVLSVLTADPEATQ